MTHRLTSTVAAVFLLLCITHTYGWIPLRSACAPSATQPATCKLPPASVPQQLASSSPRCSVTLPAQSSSPRELMAVICRGVALGALCAGITLTLGSPLPAIAQEQSQGQVQVDRYEDENYEVEQIEGKAGLGSPGNSIAEGR
jgi:hypothetical protein